MKKKLATLLMTIAAVVGLSVTQAFAQPAASGTQAEPQVSGNTTEDELGIMQEGMINDVKWSIDENGLLKITGSGEFQTGADYPRWCEYSHLIKKAEVNVEGLTDMSNMFLICHFLTEVDVSKQDFSQVTSMKDMFNGCSSLTKVDFTGADTSSLTTMEGMFSGCSNLTKIDLSPFDTSKVTSMKNMFGHCWELKTINWGNIDTSKVTDMSSMFYTCKGLESLDLTKFKTEQVTNMSLMFAGCRALKNLNISSFDTGNVTDMSGMFESCQSLLSLDVSKFNTGKVTNMNSMFNQCMLLKNIDVSTFDTENVTDMNNMFCYCESLRSIDVSSFEIANVTDMSRMFIYCKSLKQVDLSNFKNKKKINIQDLFSYAENLEVVDISGFDTSKIDFVKNYGTVFGGQYPKFKTVYSPGIKIDYCWNLPNAGYGVSWYYEPTGEEVLWMSKAGTYTTTNPVPTKNSKFEVSNATYKVTKAGKGGEVQYAAPKSKTLKTVKIPNTITYKGLKYKVTSIAPGAFKNNKNLTKVTIGTNVKAIGKNAFNGCSKLKNIIIKSKVLKSINKSAFKGIQKKAVFDVPNNKITAYKKLLKVSTGFKKKTMKVK